MSNHSESISPDGREKAGCWTVLMIVGVFALSAAGGGAWMGLGGFAGIQEWLAGKKTPDGMRYLPDQTRMLLSVRPADMLKSAPFQTLKKEPRYRDNWFVGNARLFGVTASECEQIAMGGTNAETGVFFIKLTREIDLKKDLLSRPGLKYSETRAAGIAVYDLDFAALVSLAQENPDPEELEVARAILDPDKHRIYACTPTPTVVLVSTNLAILKSVLERDRKPNLPDPVNQALVKVDLAKPVVLILDAKETGFGKNRALGIDAAKLETMTVQFDIATDIHFELAINCTDEKAAQDVKKKTEEQFAKSKPIAALFGGKDAMEVLEAIQFSVRGSSTIASLTLTTEQARKLAGLAQQMQDGR